MWYVVSNDVVWSTHRNRSNAKSSARRLGIKMAHKGYQFRVAKIRYRWSKGDNPAARYYCPLS